ncbi:serine/threonine protein kinase [Telmatocola sphagniphila]|jgi:serine/threonine protein kinase|uniref:Serine/threonine protein kinase n=1 Tax=Telmatocola sphagniphila TaxID=1123043 RepID=A0A8E6B325_9BACT|nr:serine/threonine-protein kinase [Telmatocola sphagniphila]QVL30524.1 serine/threonine protein kinase [Telmatocola sphagniphila]
MAEINEMISGYKLRSLLQTGQVSQVFEVVEPQSNRHFAMKVLLPERADDQEQRRVLFHEAEIGIKLRHENIIRIVKTDKSMTNPFFIMEYFPSGSLRKRLFDKDRDFIKEHAAKIFKQCATGLAYMHGNGWIHCDVKPDNILVNAAGDLKLIDFAISKRWKKGFFARTFHRRRKAQGTPSFMSPEQLKGELIDPRADVYSFGTTCYELLTFKKPFTGMNTNDLMNKVVYQKPDSVQYHNNDITDEAAGLILRMMQKERDKRPSTMHEVLMEFRKIRIFKSQVKTQEEY